MAKIIIRGSYCSVIGLDDLILKELEEKFTYYIKSPQYSDAVQSGDWDGSYHVFRDRHFTVGLLEDVLDAIKQYAVSVSVDDRRRLGQKFDFKFTPVNTPWPYQSQIVQEALKHKSSSIQVATGGGKTLIAAEFIASLGYNTLFLTPSREICTQTQKSLAKNIDAEIGIFNGQAHQIKPITVATWQSLMNEGYDEYLNTIDVLVVDEAQHVGANVLRQIGRRLSAIYRLGMSGTLWREDGADLQIIATCGKKIAEISYSELIRYGYLIAPKITILRMPKTKYPDWADYTYVYNKQIIENTRRNQTIVEVANRLISQGRKVLIFVTRIPHGNAIMRAGGQNFLFSTHPDRDELITKFRNGEIQCLISTSVLNEGFDLPVVDAVILAAPQKSIIATLQKIGRALRLHEGKKDAIIVDIADNTKYLWKAFQKRLEYYRKESAWKIDKIVDLTTEPDFNDEEQ